MNTGRCPCGCDCAGTRELPCGCCEGAGTRTPAAIANSPGLPTLRYRVGTHAAFLASMRARLSTLVLDLPPSEAEGPLRPLDALRTRASDDPAIALLDAWACVADVLAFYQERIANEGYLLTATELLSVYRLSRLIGYRVRPGVAASVHLAFNLDAGYTLELAPGTPAQSVPKPGETMQTFETSEATRLQSRWNDLGVRRTRPQVLDRVGATIVTDVYVKGTAANLTQGDALLLVVGDEPADRILRFVASVELQQDDDRTRVTLEPVGGGAPVDVAVRRTARALAEAAPAGRGAARAVAVLNELRGAVAPGETGETLVRRLDAAIARIAPIRDEADARGHRLAGPWTAEVMTDLEGLRARAALAVSADGGTALTREPRGTFDVIGELAKEPGRLPVATVDVNRAFSPEGDSLTRLLTIFRPTLGGVLYPYLEQQPGEPNLLRIYALRVKASPFGYNAPLLVTYEKGETGRVKPLSDWDEWDPEVDEEPTAVFLDSDYDIHPQGYAAFTRPPHRLDPADRPFKTSVFAVVDAEAISRTEYGISSRTTRLTLDDDWWKPHATNGSHEADDFSVIRRTVVYAGSEELEAAEMPISVPVAGDEIELADLHDGIETGRLVIVAGDRALPNVPAGSGVRVAELAVVAGVRQGFGPRNPGDPGAGFLPGDRFHTTLLLAQPLTYEYVRATVVLHGNIARATHGETRAEILGGGDATKRFQSFTLRQSPLTHVSAPTPAGSASTLAVRVNDVLWREAAAFVDLGPGDRAYVGDTKEDAKTVVTFGDGTRGARLPTGTDNVTATYRTGIGKPGNVQAGAITLLPAKPLGVKDVVNPLRASGGADPESRDEAKRNAPTAVMAFDRLVSVRDYEDFARTFAGIGKASAVRLAVGRRNLVHVTVAGSDDIPITTTSDLYANLLDALRRFGDPHQAVELAVRDLVVVIVGGRVRLDPAYQWQPVESRIRAALGTELGFDRRNLAQPVHASEVLAIVQSVPGVVYFDLDTLQGLSEAAALERLDDPDSALAAAAPTVVQALPARLGQAGVLPAQLAYVDPRLESAVALAEIVG